ncbi:S-ribosylhomocysteine lyase [Georgenia subflava]|uniref:S-ribosylhomocysteine lyase n=2 Tax=Georgenia subflava TaxID=1622177 RepID=A0A6N7EPE7_9MICO|nr:S-ribosylhomocysteine lyase [Georgenia subflava]
MNTESFNLDHRAVAAPYVRIADTKRLSDTVVVKKYDVRFCQPNVDHLESDVMHSLEHTFSEAVRNHSDDVIDFSPMGCQTGFYFILAGEHPLEDVRDLIAAGMQDVVDATEVPASNIQQCGWAANHTLSGAQDAARTFLARRDEWSQVMA